MRIALVLLASLLMGCAGAVGPVSRPLDVQTPSTTVLTIPDNPAACPPAQTLNLQLRLEPAPTPRRPIRR